MKLVTAILARNEASEDRYLRRVLARCAEFSDEIVLLDDASTDDTATLAESFGARVTVRSGPNAWGEEAPARAELWRLAAEAAGDGWVLICDADMLLVGDPRPLMQSWEAAAWAWPLADLWDSETTFRVDGPWGMGPVTPRPWLFRPSAARKGFVAQWNMRGVHCGHAPANWPEAGPFCVAPSDTYWLHLGWAKPEHRACKAAQYATVQDQLSPFERAHAATILDA